MQEPPTEAINDQKIAEDSIRAFAALWMNWENADFSAIRCMSTPDQKRTKRRRESAPLGWIWPD